MDKGHEVVWEQFVLKEAKPQIFSSDKAPIIQETNDAFVVKGDDFVLSIKKRMVCCRITNIIDGVFHLTKVVII